MVQKALVSKRVNVNKTWESPFAMRVLIALKEKGISYDLQEENMCNKSRLLLEMNPIQNQIPVLLHNGKPLAESLIILQYIDEAWPSTSPEKSSCPPLHMTEPLPNSGLDSWTRR